MSKNYPLSLFLTLIFTLSTVVKCGGDGGKEEDGEAEEIEGQEVDVVDTIDVEPQPDAPDVIPDGPVDVLPEETTGEEIEETTDVPEEADIPAPPSCEEPPEPAIGTTCTRDEDCEGEFARCYTERSRTFNGEEYISWKDGYCSLQGVRDSVCDIDDPYNTCPEGMKCMYLYDFGTIPVYGCMDACNPEIPGTDPPQLYDFNCGCREGYECNITAGVCLPGCSHDRECCEVWQDNDGDYERDEGEVEVLSECTNWCDNDPSEDGGASYSCINEGTAGAEFSGPCTHDSQCPVDGRCLDPIWYTDDEGNPLYPGGYCLKDRCDATGRECSDGSGNCANLGTDSEPFWACVKGCVVGSNPDAPDFPCRTEPADQKMTCVPLFVSTPFLDTTELDGHCWYGNFESTVENPNYATDCSEPSECYSPLGLGSCYTISDTDINFCSVVCNEKLAIENGVCGLAGEGVCWASMTGMCWPGCDTPGGELGANGCPPAEPPAWACYSTSDWAEEVFVAEGATMPPGFCFPACTDDTWCSDMFGMAMTCNTTTGICE